VTKSPGRSASPQLRFLLRGSVLFIVMLAVWWWLLLSPMLAGLRASTRAMLWLSPGGRASSGVSVQPDGDWMLRVPLPGFVAKQEAVQKAYGRAPGAPEVSVRSVRLVVAERLPTFFTLGFPLFWALVLAAPRPHRLGRALGVGTAVLAVLSQLSLLFYTAFTIGTNLHLITIGLGATLWSAIEYLNLNVVPYAVPLLLAAWLHSGLRAQIFSWTDEPETVTARGAAEAGKARRGKYRSRK
jgi:hypothetical protein